jgi:hypothetical protein
MSIGHGGRQPAITEPKQRYQTAAECDMKTEAKFETREVVVLPMIFLTKILYNSSSEADFRDS